MGGGGLSRARIFKLLRSPRIDSKKSIPAACEAWRAGMTTLFLSVPIPYRLYKISSTALKPHSPKENPRRETHRLSIVQASFQRAVAFFLQSIEMMGGSQWLGWGAQRSILRVNEPERAS